MPSKSSVPARSNQSTPEVTFIRHVPARRTKYPWASTIQPSATSDSTASGSFWLGTQMLYFSACQPSMGRMPRGASDGGQLALALPVADQDPPLLFVDDPPHGLLGGDRLAVVQEIDAAGQAIGIVAFRLVDHQASLRRQRDLLGAEIVRHVHFRLAGQLPEPPQQFPAVLVRHFHLGGLPQGLDHPRRSARLQRRKAIVQEHEALLEDRPRGLHGQGFVATRSTGCPWRYNWPLRVQHCRASSAWMSRRNRHGGPSSQASGRRSSNSG